jgi:uncharacterized protein DUF4179
MGDIQGIRTTPEVTPEDEALLRAALADAAPADGDIAIERSWTAFSQRIAASAATPQTRRGAGHGVPIWRRMATLPTIAAALALAILLMGAGYSLWAGPIRGFGSELTLIGNQHLYTTVNQSQTAGGLTITVTNVYADEGRTFIAYTIAPSAELRQRYDHVIVASWDLVDQDGHAPQGTAAECTPLPRGDDPIYCLLDMPSFGIAGDKLSLTWDIHTVWLLKDGQAREVVDSSRWHFTFSVPYRHVNNGQGVYPQMCELTHNACQ